MDYACRSKPTRERIVKFMHQRPGCDAEWWPDRDRNCQLFLRRSRGARTRVKTRRLRFVDRLRYRNGDDGRSGATRVRSLLYNETLGSGDWPRLIHDLRLRQAVGWAGSD